MSDRLERLTPTVARWLHEGRRREAAKAIIEATGAKLHAASDSIALEVCLGFFYGWLNRGRYDLAAMMLWPETMFTARPRATRMIWGELPKHSTIMLMGAASMSKSYSVGVWLLLDWLRDPEFTSVYVVGPTEEHLRSNLFSHLVHLHQHASLPLPGKVADLFIGLDTHDRKGSISGVIIPPGAKRGGRLQGRKRIPRKSPHPQFGALSRIRFFLDELEKIPSGVWRDIDNILANQDPDPEGFKLIGAFNPEDIAGPVAQRCEPPGGWDGFDPDRDEIWTSTRGWRVVRLDAAKCENVVEGRVIFPGLQTREGFDRIVQNSGGVHSPGYWTMARACFPPAGAVHAVIPAPLLYAARGEYVWADRPVVCASVDVALRGRDDAVMAFGRFGRAIGWRLPDGTMRKFTNPGDGVPRLQWGLQIDGFKVLPRGDTLEMASSIRREALTAGVSPEYLIVDRTGNGAGVHDLLVSLWDTRVQGLNASAGASEQKILEEDLDTPLVMYGRVVNELWFAVRKWLEFNLIRFTPAALTDRVISELSGRRYYPGKQNRIETKDEYMSRGNPSPHYADAVCLLLHGVRMASNVVPRALGDTAAVRYDDDRPDLDVFVDVTNRFYSLDDPDLPGTVSELDRIWLEINDVT